MIDEAVAGAILLNRNQQPDAPLDMTSSRPKEGEAVRSVFERHLERQSVMKWGGLQYYSNHQVHG